MAAIVHHAPRQIHRIVRFALSVEVSFVQTDRVSQAIRIVRACQPCTYFSPTNQACVSNVLIDAFVQLCPWLRLNEFRTAVPVAAP